MKTDEDLVEWFFPKGFKPSPHTLRGVGFDPEGKGFLPGWDRKRSMGVIRERWDGLRDAGYVK